MVKKTTKKPPVPTTRAPVSDRKIQLMLLILIRCKEAYLSAVDVLDPETLAAKDPGYALAWAMAIKFFKANQELPGKEFLLAEIESAIEANPTQLNDFDQDNLGQFIDFAFDPTGLDKPVDHPDYVKWSLDIARLFLEERLAVKVKMAMQDGGNNLPVNLPQILSDFRGKSEQLASMHLDEHSASFPDNWDADISLALWSTGVPFLNRYMEGQVDPEVYGLMGPFGSCKSTLGYMLHVESAKYFYAYDQNEDLPRVAVVVSYEDQMKVIQARTLGYLAQIERRSIEHMRGSLKNLSQPGNLLPYERNLFSEDLRTGQHIRSEYERAIDGVVLLNKHTLFIDLTGNDPKRRGQGMGGIDEIARIIAKACHARKVRPGHVVIDYVGAMAKRQISAPDSPYSNDDLRHLINGAALHAKNAIATQFGVPVWLIHQLSGDANSFSPTTLADHTHAAEAKSFAENLDFCYSVSKPSIDNVALFGCTKQRRQPRRENSIIVIEGNMNRVLANNGLWVLDAGQRQFVRSEDAGRIVNTAIVTATQAEVTNYANV